MSICKEKKCKRKHYGHGFCKFHYDKLYYGKNRKRILNRIEIYRQSTPDFYRRRHLRLTWGITLEEYNRMLKEQKGACKICLKPETKVINRKDGKPHNLAVDHCHKTNVIRGLLCASCNTAIGHLRDDPIILQRIIDYLDRHR